MKKGKWFFEVLNDILTLATLAFLLILLTGCAGTPKLVGPPVVVMPAASTNATYTVAQPPVRIEVANKGRQWREFVRQSNAARLESNLRIAEIEHRAAEAARAKELGVEMAPPQTAQVAPAGALVAPTATTVAASQGPTYELLPSGAVRLAPTHPLPVVGLAPMDWREFPSPPPTYERLPNGAPRLAPSWGGRVGGFGDNRNRSGAINWFTQNQSSPGLRHTGGYPTTFLNTYSFGGGVIGGGTFQSGLTGWGVER